MARYYGDMRKAVVMLGHALERAGWTLHGFHADASDAMTDYFQPASWDGVATLAPSNGGPRAVACVDVSAHDVSRLSGHGPAEMAPRSAGPCSSCRGAGREMHDNPEFRTIDLLTRAVVSVTPATVAGVTPCRGCDGSGVREETRGVVYPHAAAWPTFQANPRGAKWHVEIGGRIVATGSGVYSALDRRDGESGCHYEPAIAARFDALASKLTAAATLPARVRAEAPAGAAPDVLGDVDGSAFRVRASTVRPDYVEVLHGAKPSQEIRDELKRAGFRWAIRSACWYGPAARLPARYAGLEAAAGGAS